MRINQYVAASTGMSRRAADTAIIEGRISINGQTAVLGAEVSEPADVRLDGEALALTSVHTLIMLNKPSGYISSRAHQGGAPNLYELLPPDYLKLRITGRLDRESSGLVLLTDDGAFIQRHTHPSYEKKKVYELKLSRALDERSRQQLLSGVRLADGISHVALVKETGRLLTVTLAEGRNRQLRRTFGALGFEVERLHRIQMGSYTLGDLESGSWRIITDQLES
jgi:23S rRNA pseudouridine2605 synthase